MCFLFVDMLQQLDFCDTRARNSISTNFYEYYCNIMSLLYRINIREFSLLLFRLNRSITPVISPPLPLNCATKHEETIIYK